MKTRKDHRKSKRSPRKIRLASGELIRCPLTGELIPVCCCPVKR
jgi:hypothetical protein